MFSLQEKSYSSIELQISLALFGILAKIHSHLPKIKSSILFAHITYDP